MSRSRFLSVTLPGCLLVGVFCSPLGADPPTTFDRERVRFFERRIRPVLRKHCFKCHSASAASLKGELRLDFRGGLRAGGESGPAVIPGKPEKSLLIRAIEHKGPKMPPSGRLPKAVTTDFRTWIRNGAVDPRDKPATRRTSDGPIRLAPEDARSFWSWRPLTRPPVPRVGTSWVRNPVDAFVAAEHARADLHPAPAAPPTVLLRRASFDVVGLPPSPRHVLGFGAAGEAETWNRTIDRLLSDPGFGERWGRHWLDVARFAESDGFEMDYDRPEAWRYRDFVVRALNQDMPFDEFVRLQLAGDQLRPDDPWATVATGFLVAGVENRIQTRKDFVQHRYDKLDDFAATTGTALLGLTIGCARCHDHKYDPVAQRDYYRFTAAFAATISATRPLKTAQGVFPVYAATEAPDKRIRMRVRAEPSFKGLPSIPAKVHFLVRGDPENAREIVTTGFPPFLVGPNTPQARWFESLGDRPGRVALARWITDSAGGAGHLLARVIVNRIWHHYFGRGLVGTPNDFGTRGERPTHPELLDWLAAELIENGWRLKPIHRLVLTSATYRMGYQSHSSVTNNRTEHPDRLNRLLWRRRPRRLDAEAIRDNLIAVSQRLNLSMFGIGTLDQNHPRRSIYLRVKRSKLIPVLQLFDGPDSLQTIGQRAITTTAPQALLMLNNPFVQHSADRLSQRLSRGGAATANEVLTQGFLVTIGRPPSVDERRLAVALLTADTPAARRDFCQMLFCLNEFLYVE